MSDREDVLGDVVERLEWNERNEADSPVKTFVRSPGGRP